jgi:hypothetical protein
MAKKTRRQKQRAATRRAAPPAPTARPSSAPANVPAATAPLAADLWPIVGSTQVESEEVETSLPDAPASSGARRRIERVTQNAAAQATRTAQRPGRGPANSAALFQPLDSDDAAIPFDRVPYVPADLRRVGIMAALMVVLIIVAALIVSNLVK